MKKMVQSKTELPASGLRSPESAADAAKNFLLMFVQRWGQPDEKRADAFDRFARAAGKDPHDPATTAWVGKVLTDLEHGKFEREVEQLTAAIEANL